jgi:hypothetical protein
MTSVHLQNLTLTRFPATRYRLFPKIYLIENGAKYQSNQLYSRYNITKGNSLFVQSPITFVTCFPSFSITVLRERRSHLGNLTQLVVSALSPAPTVSQDRRVANNKLLPW